LTTTVWRIVPRKFSESPHNPFDGEGARICGGRWNSVGTSIVYASATRSLAILEKLVHAEGELSALLECVAFPVIIPEVLIRTFDRSLLPNDWHLANGSPGLKLLGDAWIHRSDSPALKVPSAVVIEEDNYLLNPLHPDFSRLVLGTAQPLPIDQRLLIRAKPIR